jgi:hypothetical protein
MTGTMPETAGRARPGRPGLARLLALSLAAMPLSGLLPLPFGAGVAEARPRSSGGYSRPSMSAPSRTPSVGSSSGYARPRTPSSGGYSLPRAGSGGSGGYGGGYSSGDSSYNRQQSGDALRRLREQQDSARQAQQPARPLPQPAPGGSYGGSYGGGRSGGGWGGGGWGGGGTGGWYRDRGWQPSGGILGGRRSFGLWDAAFMWFLFETLSRPGHADFFRNHQDDPGYREWRAEAEQRARTDAEVQGRLQDLDRRIAEGANQPRDPNYLPPDVPPEVAAAGDARTPSVAPAAAPEGSGGLAVAGVVIAGGGLLALLAWRRARGRRAAAPAGQGGNMGPLRGAGEMLRHKLSGEAYVPEHFRLGMTVTVDPTPFLLLSGHGQMQPPAGAVGGQVSVAEIGRIPAGRMVRLYLPEGRDMFQLHLDADGSPRECRYFALLDEVTPTDEAEWSAWLDPREGMLGWPEFQTKDGRVYARAWQPGQSRIEPRLLEEELETPQGRRAIRHQAMLYGAPTGAAAPAPQTEYILVSAVEDGGAAWIEIRAGIDVSPASLGLA